MAWAMLGAAGGPYGVADMWVVVRERRGKLFARQRCLLGWWEQRGSDGWRRVVAATNWRKGKQRGDMELFWSRVSLTPSWPVSFPPPAGTPLALMSVGSGLGAPTAKSASAGPKRTLGRPTRSNEKRRNPTRPLGGGGILGANSRCSSSSILHPFVSFRRDLSIKVHNTYTPKTSKSYKIIT
jgi:hypothetical protein